MTENDRLRILRLTNPFASSEVEMPVGLDFVSMGVSTSLDTNGLGGGSPPSLSRYQIFPRIPRKKRRPR